MTKRFLSHYGVSDQDTTAISKAMQGIVRRLGHELVSGETFCITLSVWDREENRDVSLIVCSAGQTPSAFSKDGPGAVKA